MKYCVHGKTSIYLDCGNMARVKKKQEKNKRANGSEMNHSPFLYTGFYILVFSFIQTPKYQIWLFIVISRVRFGLTL